jgi:DNA repair exonuclease SbcCD nuclease subunit
MAKAATFTDMHIHSHKDSVERLHDCLKVLDWIFSTAIEHKCEHVIFLGDLFHERAKIDVLNYLRTFEVFMRYMAKASFDLWLLVGNHDMYHKEKWDVNSVKPLTAIPNVHIIDEPKTINIGGLDIDFCPHTENPIKELAKLKKGRAKESLKCLMGHMAVHGAQLNKLYGTRADVIVEYDNDMLPVSVDIFNDWDQTFLGHYHGAQQLNEKVEYIGSPLQLSFGEAFQDKHIVILDLDTQEKEYVKNTFSPVHYIIEPHDISTYDLNANFVRIVGNMTGKDIVDLKKTVNDHYKVASLDFKQKEKKEEEDRVVVEGAKDLLKDEDEMMATFVKKKGVPAGLDEKHLMEIGKFICKKLLKS